MHIYFFYDGLCGKYSIPCCQISLQQLKDCGEPIKNAKLIKHFMTHLPPKYAPFVSSYNTHKLTMGSSFTKPSFNKFSEMLVLEHHNLVIMVILQSSKTKALVSNQENQGGKNLNKKKK